MSDAIGNSRPPAAGTRVQVINAGPPPEWSEWDDDGGRTSGSVKKRLAQLFFGGDKRIHAEIMYVASESERDELKRKGRTKVRVKEAAGSTLVLTADLTNLEKRR